MYVLKEDGIFSSFILLLFISKNVIQACSYQANCSSEKFYISPKVDVENKGKGFKVLICVLQQSVFSILRGLMKLFKAVVCDGLQHITEGSLSCQSP